MVRGRSVAHFFSETETFPREIPAGCVTNQCGALLAEGHGGFRVCVPICRRIDVIELKHDEKHHADEDAERDQADENFLAEPWLSRFCEQRHLAGSPANQEWVQAGDCLARRRSRMPLRFSLTA